MKLNEIKKPENSTFKKKRVGRGDGSGLGKTSGRGSDGQKSRAGYSRKASFEGGQMPLIRRVPKRGFTNIFKVSFSTVNLDVINTLNEESVTPEILIEKGLVQNSKKNKKKNQKIKILGNGEINKKVIITAHAFSKSAVEKIEKAGGKVEIVEC